VNVVIIEDDRNKSRQLVQLVQTVCKDIDIDECRSYQSGLRRLVDRPAHLVLLDMSMPTFDATPHEKGGRTRGFAGRDILDELKRRRVVTSVVVVTQFESFGEGRFKKTLRELQSELTNAFPGLFLCAIYYHPAQSAWRESLATVVRDSIEKGNRND
jgi:CheY-like chemotaxis protein